MPKIKIFLWQICHQAIPVRGTLLKRGLDIDVVCPVCLGDIESIDHLFSECHIGRKVWELADKHHWFPIQFSPDGYHQLTEMLQRVRSSRNPRLLQKLSFLIWSIWKEKNSVAFENKFSNPVKCLTKAKRLMPKNLSLYIGRLFTEGCSFYPSQNLPPCKVEPPTSRICQNQFWRIAPQLISIKRLRTMWLDGQTTQSRSSILWEHFNTCGRN